MAGMNDGGGHNHGMGDMGMTMSPPPSPTPMTNNTSGMNMMMNHGHHMMHMTFFWGKNAEILFPGWPGYDNLGMYLLALVFVFCLSLIVECLAHCNLIKESTNNNHLVAGILETAVYGLKVCLSYIVMLAVMSFNIGVFLVAIAGHVLGFLVFGSRVFKKPSPDGTAGKRSDPRLMGCEC